MTDYGIDISHYQTLTSPAAVRGNGIAFAWIKATEGADYRDPAFSGLAANLAAVGIRTGVYHFARPGSAAGQARFLRSVASGDMGNGHLYPVLDMEDNAIGDPNGFINQFYDALGGPMVVYANLDWWTHRLNPIAWGNRNIVGWIARYNGDPGNPGFTYPRMVAHQHTDAGNVPGFAGTVDRNVSMPGKSLADFTIGSTKEVDMTPDEMWNSRFSWVSRQDGKTKISTFHQFAQAAMQQAECYLPGRSDVGPAGTMATYVSRAMTAAETAANKSVSVTVDPAALKAAISEALAGVKPGSVDVEAVATAVAAKFSAKLGG